MVCVHPFIHPLSIPLFQFTSHISPLTSQISHEAFCVSSLWCVGEIGEIVEVGNHRGGLEGWADFQSVMMISNALT